MTPIKQDSKQQQNVVPKNGLIQPRIETNALLMLTEHWNRMEIIAERAFKSGVLPSAIKNKEMAFIIAMKGHELGLSPMYAMEHIVVINGKASIDGQAMLRLIYERCPGAKLHISTPPEKQSQECEWEMQRPSQKPMQFRFTLDDAKRAGLLDKPGPWKQYPKAMLKWRALSDGARTVFTDIIGGVYLHEEMGAVVDEDGNFVSYDASRTAARDVTPPPPAASPTNDASQPVGEENEPAKELPAEAKTLAETFQKDEKANELGWDSQKTQTQAIRRLFQVTRARGWSEENLRQHIEFTLGKDSTKELAWDELNHLLKHIEANPKGGELANGVH